LRKEKEKDDDEPGGSLSSSAFEEKQIDLFSPCIFQLLILCAHNIFERRGSLLSPTTQEKPTSRFFFF
jgi:hypothetical protein